MKIALLTLDFPPSVGGVQQYLFEIARRIGQIHDLTVVTPVAGPLPKVPFRRLILPSSHPWAFARALLALRPDRVLVGHTHPRLLVPTALAAWGSYSVIAHGNDLTAAQKRWHRPLFNWLLRHAKPVITNSKNNAHRLKELGVREPVVAYPGVDPSRFTPPLSPPPSPWILLTVGRLVPRKGIDTVIQALPSLLAEFPDLRYVIAGEGPDRRRLEELAKELGVLGRIEFLGYVPDDKLPEIYRSAHIFVMPTREEAGASMEGFGIVFLEASASGLPVVAGRSGGAVEAVRDGETGLLVPPNDPGVLAQALLRLLRHPELRQQMGTTGRRWVEERMSWDHTAERVMRSILETL